MNLTPYIVLAFVLLLQMGKMHKIDSEIEELKTLIIEAKTCQHYIH